MKKATTNGKKNFQADKMQEIVTAILDDMKTGILPWEQPWIASSFCPTNATTNVSYRGINTLFLSSIQAKKGFKTGFWLTFRQATLAGGRIKTGSHGFPVVFYDRVTKQEEKKDQNGTTEEKTVCYSLLKFYTVFNLDQTEGLEKLYPKPAEAKKFNGVETAETIIKKTGADVRLLMLDRAFYNVSDDFIALPLKENFKTVDGFYSTAFHELTHWTGAEKRLKRDQSGAKGSTKYAFEELVAELGAAFLMNGVSMPYSTQHAAYVQSWIEVLKNDTRTLFRAAALAQNAADLITGKTFTAKKEEAA